MAGLILVRPRISAASGAGKVLVLGPVFEAVALAMFAAEHFLAAKDLAGIVPSWLPVPLFWTYLVGAALAGCGPQFHRVAPCAFVGVSARAAVSDHRRHHRSAHPSGNIHDRFFWILTLRETTFASGAMVLAGSLWPAAQSAGAKLVIAGRSIVACAFVFYAIEHFLFPHNVPGVPLEKMTPAWLPAPTLLSYFIGATLFAAAIGLIIPRTRRIAAAGAGTVLVLLTLFFYVPILVTEIHSPLAVEGINYVGDTLLFAATALLAGFGAGNPETSTT